MKFLETALFLLLPFWAVAQNEIEFVEEVKVAPSGVSAGVSASANDNQSLALYDYAAKTLNMKAISGQAPTKVNTLNVKDTQTGAVHQLSTSIQDLMSNDPNSKASAAIVTITDQTTGKSYKAILYDKTGDGTNVQEFKANSVANNSQLKVAGVSSFISCVLSCSRKSASAISHCGGSWTKRLKCIITTVGYGCYAKCAWKLLW
jgi:hypothetical protein